MLADRSYCTAEVLACEGSGVLPSIPKTQTSGNANRGLSLWPTSSTDYNAGKDCAFRKNGTVVPLNCGQPRISGIGGVHP